MKHILLTGLLFGGSLARALAPAVNGGALIAGDAAFESDLNFKHSDVITAVKPTGERRANQDAESIRNFTLRAAHRSPSTWQFGGEVLADRTRVGADATALSELNFNAGAATGPATTYLQLTVPVSRSAYEQEDQYQLNALGRGFWAVGVGQFWRHAWGPATGFVTYEVHRSLARDFANAGNAGRLVPGYGFNWSVGESYRVARVTAGVAVAGSYEDPVAVRGDRQSRGGSAQRFLTPGLNVGVELNQGWSFGVAYADQTILPAATADLVREIGLTLAKSWD